MMKRVISFAIALLIATGTILSPQPRALTWAQEVSPRGNDQAFHRTAERLGDLPGLKNVGQVSPGIYRGAQVGEGGYSSLKKLGIKTVIDLRTTATEKSRVEAAGMKAVAVPITMSGDGLKEKVDRVVALMADPANQPVFVHCRHGQDRTGIVVAAYRIKHQGWSVAEAEAEMDAFGFNKIWVNFREFIREYGKAVAR